MRSHLREDDIVALLVAKEEGAWEPRERFIFASGKLRKEEIREGIDDGDTAGPVCFSFFRFLS